MSNGDGGIDIIGNYKHYVLLVQCKDLTKQVSVGEIRSFLKIIKDYPKDILGVFVISKKNGYSTPSIECAESAKNEGTNILLTNIYTIQKDIEEYELNDESFLIIKKIEEKFEEKFEDQDKKINEKINEKMEELQKKAIIRDKIIICLLFVIIILIIILILY